MTKPKPKITKREQGWQVELPPFGFHGPVVKAGFPRRQDAGRWLASNQNIGSSAQSVEKATRPWSRHADMNVPQVYR